MHRSRTLAYCTDLEHGPDWSNNNFHELIQDADCLIVDAQYTPEEYLSHQGWGHSTWQEGVTVKSKEDLQAYIDFLGEKLNVYMTRYLERRKEGANILLADRLEFGGGSSAILWHTSSNLDVRLALIYNSGRSRHR